MEIEGTARGLSEIAYDAAGEDGVNKSEKLCKPFAKRPVENPYAALAPKNTTTIAITAAINPWCFYFCDGGVF